MIIYLENYKYEFELKVLLQSLTDSSMIKFDHLENYHPAADDYLVFKRSKDKPESVICTGQLEGKSIEAVDPIRSYEKSDKSSYKRIFYTIFSKFFDKKLDWGILTGIRPTKLFNEYNGFFQDKEERNRVFAEDFFVSAKKTDLLSYIDDIRQEKLAHINQDNYSVYISVPFCPSKCSYCTFFSNDIKQKSHLTKAYIRALEEEMNLVLKTSWADGRQVDSLYFGGGTPSSLNLSDLDDLLETIDKIMDFSQIKEITFEAGRADTITLEKLKLIKSYGIDRISINPQTMVGRTLEAIGRNHGEEDIVRSFYQAREAGFDNINMDIILGLEDENLDDLNYTLSKILELKPDSVTMHSLALKRSSDLTKVISDNTKANQNKTVLDMTDFVYGQMKASGYHPYYLYRQKNTLGGQENIGFSLKGKESLYNIFIIEEYQHILAFGPGAVSRYVYPSENRMERVSNTKNLEEYINNIHKYANRKLEMQNEKNSKS